MNEPVCRVCGTTEDLVGLSFITVDGAHPKPLCRTHFNELMDNTAHTCRGCGRTDLSRATGMHTTPLEVDGTLRHHDRMVRSGPDEPWHPEPEIINRVICANCCPAVVHDDGVWCTVMHPSWCRES